MSDERIIRALGKVAREQEAAPIDDQLRSEACAPCDDAELDRLTRVALDGLGPPATAPAKSAADVVILPAKSAPRGRSRLAVVTAVVALAAGVALVLRAPSEDAPLPRYELAVVGGDKPLRAGASGDASEVPLLHPGSSVDLVARPDRSVVAAVEARAFAVTGGRLVPLAAPIARSEDGTFRIRGTREVVLAGIAPGRVEIAIAIGRRGAFARAPETSADLDRADLQILRRTVELAP